MYKNLLVAIDLSPVSEDILRHAKEIATSVGAQLNLLHVIEHSPLAYGGEFSVPINPNLEQQFEHAALTALTDLCNQFNISTGNQFLKTGSVKHAVINLAKEMGADLIVIGSHGKHGINFLLGSSANAILHSAPCDVYIVKVKS